MTEKVVHSNQGVDSFDDNTPIELPDRDSPQDGGGKNNNGLETFDDQEVKIPESHKEENEDKKDEDAEKKEIKRETDKLEDQEKDEESDDDEEPEEEDDGEKGDDKSDEEEESDKSEDTRDKPKGKTIRVKDGDEKLDISEDADIPVKIKGKKEFVSLKDLRDNYSGHKAWTEEIESAKAKNSEYETKISEFEEQKAATREHFAKIGEMIHKGFEDPNADPLQAMKYLVDLSGRNVLEFEKRMMDHYGSLAGSFSELSEAEQNLYWTQRENEILKDSQTTRLKEVENRKAQEQRVQQISKTMESYGISEQDFEATEAELEQLGYDLDDVSADQICKWAALKPLVETSTELASQFEDDLSDSEMETLITGTADTMFKIPDIEPFQALQLTARKLGFEVYQEDEIVDKLKNKHKGGEDRLQNREKAKVASKHAESRGFESFDDFDDEIYG